MSPENRITSSVAPVMLERMHPTTNCVVSVLFATACMTLAIEGSAQEQTGGSTPGATLDEVIVTAQKRSESLQRVPLSIAVLSSETFANQNLQNVTQITSSVPSVSSFDTGPGRSMIIVRGINTGALGEDDPQAQETVGLYVDETPISVNGFNPQYGLFDVERVEVLRGPQGTLYGAGAVSGAIRVVTRKPDVSEVSGEVNVGVSTTDRSGSDENTNLQGMLNLPLVAERVALRMSGYRQENSGYIDNLTTGDKNINENTATGGRLALRAQPTDRVTIDLSASLHEFEDGARPIDEGGFARSFRSPEDSDYSYDVYNATIDWSTDWGSFLSSTSLLKVDLTNRRALDSVLDLFSTTLTGALADQTSVDDFTQEFRFASRADAQLSWLVGAYYNQRDRDYLNAWPVPGWDETFPDLSGPTFGAPTDHLFYAPTTIDISQWAIFGEVTYQAGPWSATIGARAFDWKEDFRLDSAGLFNGGVTTSGDREAKESGVNPKFSINYSLSDDALVYAQAAKGFRFGGVNQVVPLNVCGDELAENNLPIPPPADYDPDSLWSYEIGSKNTAMDGRLSLNASAFIIKWSDVQTRRALACGFSFKQNSGEMTSQGVEFEATLRPVPALTLTLGASYVDAALDQDVPDLGALEGDEAPFVPQTFLTSSIEYQFQLLGGNGFFWTGYRYIDDRTTEFNPAAARYRVMDSYSVVDARIGVEFGKFEVAIFGNNLSDSDGVVRALAQTAFDSEGAYRITPRTVGVTLGVRF